MISLQKLTPEIYYKQSRDFQLFGRLFDVVLNSVKTNSELLRSIPSYTKDLGSDVISLLSSTLGFETKHQYPVRQLAAILSVFSSILKTKGTLSAVQIAGAAILRSEGITDQFVCRKNENVLEVFLPEDLSDTNLFTDLLNYILPAGIICKVVRANLATVKALDRILIKAGSKDSVSYSKDQNIIDNGIILPGNELQEIFYLGRDGRSITADTAEENADTVEETTTDKKRSALSWTRWEPYEDKPIYIPGLTINSSVIGSPFDSAQELAFRHFTVFVNYGKKLSEEENKNVAELVEHIKKFFGGYYASTYDIFDDKRNATSSITEVNCGGLMVGGFIQLPDTTTSLYNALKTSLSEDFGIVITYEYKKLENNEKNTEGQWDFYYRPNTKYPCRQIMAYEVDKTGEADEVDETEDDKDKDDEVLGKYWRFNLYETKDGDSITELGYIIASATRTNDESGDPQACNEGNVFDFSSISYDETDTELSFIEKRLNAISDNTEEWKIEKLYWTSTDEILSKELFGVIKMRPVNPALIKVHKWREYYSVTVPAVTDKYNNTNFTNIIRLDFYPESNMPELEAEDNTGAESSNDTEQKAKL